MRRVGARRLRLERRTGLVETVVGVVVGAEMGSDLGTEGVGGDCGCCGGGFSLC